MEDIHSFTSRPYDKSEPINEPTVMDRVLTLLPILPGLIVKTLFVILLQICLYVRELYHLIVPKSLKEIRGQLAVVTGGSNGIGREICLELARSGCNVACLDVDLEAAKKLCSELEVLGVKANAYKVDITDYERVEDAKKQINADMGTVDILVNNAGLMPTYSFRGSAPNDIRRLFEVNVLAHFWTTRIFIGDMIARRSGVIVAISSLISLYPMSISVAYTTTKCAVTGFMEALNRDIRHEQWGIRTLTVFPHTTNTRKEIVDYVLKKVGQFAYQLKTYQRIGIVNPVDVGKETVAAIRNGSPLVSIPRSLFREAQNIADELYMPRINSRSDHSASIKRAATDKGHKKL